MANQSEINCWRVLGEIPGSNPLSKNQARPTNKFHF